MLVSDFDYDLPPELIAQEPAVPRDHSRLMRLSRATGAVSHHRFDALPHLLRRGDLLVFNDTRVLRARLRGYKMAEPAAAGAVAEAAPQRGARVEALLLREIETNLWEALLKPSARLRPGTPLCFASRDGEVEVRAAPVARTAHGWIVRFGGGADVRTVLPRLGEVPLPPYIAAQLRDEECYQTVFARGGTVATAQADAARRLESAAAPTAGLHFTPAVLNALRERGIQSAFVTLQIGIGTFRPMQSETVAAHTMHEEEYEIPDETARLIREQKRRGGRVVAVGTTTTRVLEAAAANGDAAVNDAAVNGDAVNGGATASGEAATSGEVRAGLGRTSIFIRPGHRFRIVDGLLTNFHLPRSTLLVMVAAFAQDGRDGQDRRDEQAEHAHGHAHGKGGEDEDDGKDTEGGEEGSVMRLPGLQKVRYAYSQAVRERYRFFSFGDAMLIE